MKSLLMVLVSFAGFSAYASGEVISCDALGLIQDGENMEVIYDTTSCRDVTTGNVVGVTYNGENGWEIEYGDVRTPVGRARTEVVSDYFTYFPTEAAARANCNIRDSVVWDYWYKAYRCQGTSNNENGGE